MIHGHLWKSPLKRLSHISRIIKPINSFKKMPQHTKLKKILNQNIFNKNILYPKNHNYSLYLYSITIITIVDPEISPREERIVVVDLIFINTSQWENLIKILVYNSCYNCLKHSLELNYYCNLFLSHYKKVTNYSFSLPKSDILHLFVWCDNFFLKNDIKEWHL